MDSSYRIIVGIMVLGILTGAGILLSGSSESGHETTAPVSDAQRKEGSATIEQGTQYVDIITQGGYSPRITKAQAGIATVIRMRTQDTYDCSSALVIPVLGYQAYLPATGVTEISVPVDKTQGTLEGLCSMGMYHFSVVFE
jgi:plastocyanin domain-containing protein